MYCKLMHLTVDHYFQFGAQIIFIIRVTSIKSNYFIVIMDVFLKDRIYFRYSIIPVTEK